MQSLRSGGKTVMALALVIVWGPAAFAQQTPAGRGRGQAAAPATTRPPLLFKEEWKLPAHEGAPTDENMRFTPAVVSNDRLEAKVYGPGSSVIRAAEHEGRIDLWTGLATSPVAVTLRDKRNYMDLTGLARLRWMVRTTAIHTLYPVVKLAHGTYIAGNRGFTTDGDVRSQRAAMAYRGTAFANSSTVDKFADPATPCPPPGASVTIPTSSTLRKSGSFTSEVTTTFIGSSLNHRMPPNTTST